MAKIFDIFGRARAHFLVVFSNMAAKKNFFFKKIFFFLVCPKYICMPKMKFIGQKMKKKPSRGGPSP